MKYIKIQSQGVIDPQAFSLIGASSKREDKTKIGYFGSGLKYSIAYLLRNNITFKVFGDFKEHIFTKESVPFRDKPFDVIVVNGERTSLTTEMGIDWEPWFIVREIYCNALDEGESKISLSSKEPVPVQEQTIFYLDSEPFKDVVDNWGKYFSEGRDEKELLYKNEKGFKIFVGGSDRIIYRKGIRCHYSKDDTIFHYDMPRLEINESRTIKSDWDFRMSLTECICLCPDLKIIGTLVALINESWEKGLYWEYSCADKFSDVWLEAIGNRTLVPNENAGFWSETMKEHPGDYVKLPSLLCVALKKFFADKVRIAGEGLDTENGPAQPVSRSPRMDFMLKEALEFLAKANYEVKHPIEVVKFMSNKTLGEAVQDKILISEKVFDKGRKYLITTIVEENEHHISGFGDETRSFQNHIFGRWVSTMEEKTGIYL